MELMCALNQLMHALIQLMCALIYLMRALIDLTTYMAEKIMYLQVDQQHIMDAFCLYSFAWCPLPLSEYIFCQVQIENFLKKTFLKFIVLP
jgi:hypothetical protein